MLPALEELGFGVGADPRGAFYIYADIARFGINSQTFAHRLIEQAGGAATPELDFGVNGADHHVRFAYTTSLERLQESVTRIAHFLERTQISPPPHGAC